MIKFTIELRNWFAALAEEDSDLSSNAKLKLRAFLETGALGLKKEKFKLWMTPET